MQANKIILQQKYARIVQLFAEKTNCSYEQALGIFYDSKTFELISEGVADMHCMSDEYWLTSYCSKRRKSNMFAYQNQPQIENHGNDSLKIMGILY